jgi:hypothetical protein
MSRDKKLEKPTKNYDWLFNRGEKFAHYKEVIAFWHGKQSVLSATVMDNPYPEGSKLSEIWYNGACAEVQDLTDAVLALSE